MILPRTPEDGLRGAAAQTRSSILDATGREAKPSRFQLLTFEEILALPDPSWLIEGVIPQEAVTQLYGDSGVGKTFVALDMALSIATGTPWLDKYHTDPGRVVYVVAEGHLGIKHRVSAWMAYHGREASDLSRFRSLTEPLPLGDARAPGDFIKAVDAAFAGEDISLIVLDTQARCTAGLEENSAQEMGLAIDRIDRIKRVTGATVLLVHHEGYKKGHARGSTAVHAALETQAALHGPTKALTLSCKKQKDSKEFDDIRISLLEVGGSLVPVLSGEGSPAHKALAEQGLTQTQRGTFDALRHGHASGATHGEWRKTAMEMGVKKTSFDNAIQVLCEDRLVRKTGNLYFPVETESRQSSPAQPKSREACSEVVHRSTTPLGGGLVDSDASEAAVAVDRAVAGAWEDSSDDSL